MFVSILRSISLKYCISDSIILDTIPTLSEHVVLYTKNITDDLLVYNTMARYFGVENGVTKHVTTYFQLAFEKNTATTQVCPGFGYRNIILDT